jgi:hypothetical protein
MGTSLPSIQILGGDVARRQPTADKAQAISAFIVCRENHRVQALLAFHESCLLAAAVYRGADFGAVCELARLAELTPRRLKQMALVGDRITREEMGELAKHKLKQADIIRLAGRGREDRRSWMRGATARGPGTAKAGVSRRSDREDEEAG